MIRSVFINDGIYDDKAEPEKSVEKNTDKADEYVRPRIFRGIFASTAAKRKPSFKPDQGRENRNCNDGRFYHFRDFTLLLDERPKESVYLL